MKKSTKIYHWLFSEEERAPIGFIPALAMSIVISAGICLFFLGIFGVTP